jgi:hypothetical protein
MGTSLSWEVSTIPSSNSIGSGIELKFFAAKFGTKLLI